MNMVRRKELLIDRVGRITVNGHKGHTLRMGKRGPRRFGS